MRGTLASTTIGERIDLLRRIMGLNKTQFVRLWGITQAGYNGYLRGVNVPTYEVLLRLREVFQPGEKISFDYIYLGELAGLSKAWQLNIKEELIRARRAPKANNAVDMAKKFCNVAGRRRVRMVNNPVGTTKGKDPNNEQLQVSAPQSAEGRP